MNRFAIALLSTLLTVLFGAASLAAPAPFPRGTGPWFDGWDKPVNPLGDCRFERKGDQLTTTVPGKTQRHVFIPGLGGTDTAPRLLRDVKGDFAVQVRVRAAFQAAKGNNHHCYRTSLLVTSGANQVWLYREASDRCNAEGIMSHQFSGYHQESWPESWHAFAGWAVEPEDAAHLRLERRGNRVALKYSQDGKKWKPVGEADVNLPRKVKVGILAEASRGELKVVFDQFKLSR